MLLVLHVVNLKIINEIFYILIFLVSLQNPLCNLQLSLYTFQVLTRRRQWHPTPVLLRRKSHGWRSLVGCSPWGRQSQTRLSDFTFTHWRRKWQPIPVFLPGESQGQGSLVGCRLWGRTESDTTEATQQQQQQQQSVVSSYHASMLSHSVSQPCLTLRNPMDCSLPGSSVHEIFQTRILQRATIFSSRGSS